MASKLFGKWSKEGGQDCLDTTIINFAFFFLFVHEYVWPICFSAELFERGIYKPRPTTLNTITIFIHGNLSDSINQPQQWQF